MLPVIIALLQRLQVLPEHGKQLSGFLLPVQDIGKPHEACRMGLPVFQSLDAGAASLFSGEIFNPRQFPPVDQGFEHLAAQFRVPHGIEP
jgi:hypothetical protein